MGEVSIGVYPGATTVGSEMFSGYRTAAGRTTTARVRRRPRRGRGRFRRAAATLSPILGLVSVRLRVYTRSNSHPRCHRLPRLLRPGGPIMPPLQALLE